MHANLIFGCNVITGTRNCKVKEGIGNIQSSLSFNRCAESALHAQNLLCIWYSDAFYLEFCILFALVMSLLPMVKINVQWEMWLHKLRFVTFEKGPNRWNWYFHVVVVFLCTDWNGKFDSKHKANGRTVVHLDRLHFLKSPSIVWFKLWSFSNG